MAAAMRYGHMQPSEFEALDYEEGALLAARVKQLAVDEFEATAELHETLTKHLLQGLGQIVGMTRL